MSITRVNKITSSKNNFHDDGNAHWVVKPDDPLSIRLDGYFNPSNNMCRTPSAQLRYAGRNHFNNGGELKDAPIELQNNKDFIFGYNQAMEIAFESYSLGFKTFIDNKSISDLPRIYQTNKYVIQGYNDARELCLIDGINVPFIPDEGDVRMFSLGKKWALSGKSLGEAPSECQYNTYFLNGYDKYYINSNRGR